MEQYSSIVLGMLAAQILAATSVMLAFLEQHNSDARKVCIIAAAHAVGFAVVMGMARIFLA